MQWYVKVRKILNVVVPIVAEMEQKDYMPV